MLDGCTREFDKHGSLKILETEANTHWKEPSESYIDTIQACKHKMPLYLFRFSVLFTKGHFIIEQCISQNQKRNLLGLRDRFQINVRRSKNYINSLSDDVRLPLLSHLSLFFMPSICFLFQIWGWKETNQFPIYVWEISKYPNPLHLH